MSKRSRRYHAPSQKADLLRQHHVEKVPISELCNQHQLQPSVFYTWQRHLWEHASQVFTDPKPSSREHELEAEVAALLDVLPRLPGTVILVSNEVGWGIVPMNPLSRLFADEQGRLNQRVAAVCDRVTLVAAGLPLALKG